MTQARTILIVSNPELSRSLEAPFRLAGWSVFRSPDLEAINAQMSTIRPSALLIGLDTPWFDANSLDHLVSASEWNIPVTALTSLTAITVEGPVTFLPVDTSIAEIVRCVDQVASRDKLGITPFVQK